MSGAYIAALPVIPVFVASQTEFDLCGLVAGALRWRRLEGRYVPGAGESASGYVLSVERADRDPTEAAAVELDLQALWEHRTACAEPVARTPWPAATAEPTRLTTAPGVDEQRKETR